MVANLSKRISIHMSAYFFNRTTSAIPCILWRVTARLFGKNLKAPNASHLARLNVNLSTVANRLAVYCVVDFQQELARHVSKRAFVEPAERFIF